MFFKIGALKDFVIFWIKKRLQQRCFCKYCFFFFFFFFFWQQRFYKTHLVAASAFSKRNETAILQRYTGKVRPRTWDSGPGTREPYMGSWTRNPPPETLSEPGTFTWESGPRALHLGPFTLDLGPYMWEPEPPTFMRKAGPILGNPYINTTFSQFAV